MTRSSPTRRKVRKMLRAGSALMEGGWRQIQPLDWKNNIAQLVAYIKGLPGGGPRSRAGKIALDEARKVRAKMIVYPEDWILRSIELAQRAPIKKLAPVDGPMGSPGPYTLAVRARGEAHEGEIVEDEPDIEAAESEPCGNVNLHGAHLWTKAGSMPRSPNNRRCPGTVIY